MAIPAPTIDDRVYREILDEALARIAVHNPEWTNFNESDPGVTLLQLFAFMAESIHYRANLIPERNRRKFLRLLGVPLNPAAAATGVVTFLNDRGPGTVSTLPQGMAVLAGQTEFRTLNALDVLPVEGRLYLKSKIDSTTFGDALATWRELFAIEEAQAEPSFYETVPIEPPRNAAEIGVVDVSTDAVDETLWIALLARPGEAPDALRGKLEAKTLSLGVMPWVDDRIRALRLASPGSEEPSGVPFVFDVANGGDASGGARPTYSRLDPRADGDLRRELTLIQLTLPASDEMGVWTDFDPGDEGSGDYPPSLEDDEVAERVVTWLRMRPAPGVEPPGGADFTVSWVGINATRIHQRSDVVGEPVGRGTGEPDIVFTVTSRPVITDTAQVTVNGEPWTRIDDLLAAPPEIPVRDPAQAPGGESYSANGTQPGESTPEAARVFSVDRESGEISFGDGLRGARPRGPVVVSYGYGGGGIGNVGIGAIKTAPQLPAGFKVVNPLPTWGGAEGETVEEAERSIPQVLRHRERAVARDDYGDIVRGTPGVAIGRIEVLPLFHPGAADVETGTPGAVTVMVVPPDPFQTGAPEPDRFFLEAVCRHLGPRRVLTTEVYVEGPVYVPIAVSIGFEVVPGADIPTVREAVRAEIRDFLSPLTGGFQEEGWPLGKAIVDRELWARATRAEDVATLSDVKLWRITDDGFTTETEIPLSGLELPRIQQLAVTDGAPEDLTESLSQQLGVTGGAQVPPVQEPPDRVPVPVLPPEC